MRRIAAALAVLAALVGALVVGRGAEQTADALFPADRLEFAREDWQRPPDQKLLAAAVGATCEISSGTGDLDGDRRLDTVLTYSADGSCRNERVAVFASNGTTAEAAIDIGDLGKLGETCPSVCSVYAIADLDGDARSEVLLELAESASHDQLGVYRLGPRGLVPVVPGLFWVEFPLCCLRVTDRRPAA